MKGLVLRLVLFLLASVAHSASKGSSITVVARWAEAVEVQEEELGGRSGGGSRDTAPRVEARGGRGAQEGGPWGAQVSRRGSWGALGAWWSLGWSGTRSQGLGAASRGGEGWGGVRGGVQGD